jgi:hypothetical protein
VSLPKLSLDKFTGGYVIPLTPCPLNVSMLGVNCLYFCLLLAPFLVANPPPPQVPLPKLSLDKFTDSYFKAAEKKQQKGNKGEDEFFKKGEPDVDHQLAHCLCVSLSDLCVCGRLQRCGCGWRLDLRALCPPACAKHTQSTTSAPLP